MDTPPPVNSSAPAVPATPPIEANGDCKNSSNSSSNNSTSNPAVASDENLPLQQQEERRRTSSGLCLPSFYVAGEGGRGRGKRPANNSLEARKSDIEGVWRGRPSLRAVEFEECVRDLLGLPGIVTRTVMERVKLLCGNDSSSSSRAGQLSQKGGSSEGELRVSLDAFLKYWPLEVEPYDEDERFFRLIKQPASNTFVRGENDCISLECTCNVGQSAFPVFSGFSSFVQIRPEMRLFFFTSCGLFFADDLSPLVNELVATHPGLQFLQSAEEVQRLEFPFFHFSLCLNFRCDLLSDIFLPTYAVLVSLVFSYIYFLFGVVLLHVWLFDFS